MGHDPAFNSLSSDRKQLELSSREVWAAVGFNSSLFGGNQAAAVREAWRLALFGVLSPLGLLKALVRRVNRRMKSRILRFWRST